MGPQEHYRKNGESQDNLTAAAKINLKLCGDNKSVAILELACNGADLRLA